MTGRIELDFAVSSGLATPVPAAEIWDRFDQTGRIDQVGPGRSVQLTGGISFKLDGQELLGPDYWLEIFNLVHLAPLVAGTYTHLHQQVVAKGGLSGEMQFHRTSDEAASYSLEVNEPTARDRSAMKVRNKRAVPLKPLADAWTYLWFRVHRLAAELGDESSISATTSRDKFFPAGYFDSVDESVIAFALEAPLQEVLATPKSFG